MGGSSSKPSKVAVYPSPQPRDDQPSVKIQQKAKADTHKQKQSWVDTRGVISPELNRPYTWDDFKFIKELSSGAFGRVLIMSLIVNPKKIFIIKCLPYTSDEKKKLADEEVRVMKLVKSKCTVRFIQSFVHQIDLCILLEYCEGGNLRELIQQMKTWSVKDKIIKGYQVLFQVLMGLDVMHKLGIVHRDLKPENIFLDLYGNAKTGDFGLAQNIESKSYLKTAGTKKLCTGRSSQL